MRKIAIPPDREHAVREDSPDQYARNTRVRFALVVALIAAVAGLAAWHLEDLIPRKIVLASGVANASYHQDAKNYVELLHRHHVAVIERMSRGAADNVKLLLDPRQRVDVAFMEGGVIPRADREKLVMLAAIRYEPVWVFYRGSEAITRLDQLKYKRIAIGAPGNGGRVIVEPMLEASGVTGSNTNLLPIGSSEGLNALRSGRADAVVIVGAARSPLIWEALHDDSLTLMSFEDADAYSRRFPYLYDVTLPAGTIDMSYRRIPDRKVVLVATKTMLVARPDLPPAIVNLFVDAARELHGEQGFFEASQEFPSVAPVDLPVSQVAEQHVRFGPSFLHRHLPFWAATIVERLLIVVLPILLVFVPVFNLLPQLFRWRIRSRIFRWYGELKMLEQEVERRTKDPPIARWLGDLDRITRAAEHIRTPASLASEAYTLREHIALVRQAVLSRCGDAPQTARVAHESVGG